MLYVSHVIARFQCIICFPCYSEVSVYFLILSCTAWVLIRTNIPITDSSTTMESTTSKRPSPPVDGDWDALKISWRTLVTKGSVTCQLFSFFFNLLQSKIYRKYQVTFNCMDAVIQLPPMRFLDSSVSSLICSCFASGIVSGHKTLLQYPWVDTGQLPDSGCSISDPVNSDKGSLMASGCLPWSKCPSLVSKEVIFFQINGDDTGDE